jgi:hypothetical protein
MSSSLSKELRNKHHVRLVSLQCNHTADKYLYNRHGHFLYERMMKYGLSEGSTRGAMARLHKYTARSGSFMSIVSNGTRRTGQACQSVFTPATLLLPPSNLTRTGELGRHYLGIYSKDSLGGGPYLIGRIAPRRRNRPTISLLMSVFNPLSLCSLTKISTVMILWSFVLPCLVA